jgi:hypothetical protein
MRLQPASVDWIFMRKLIIVIAVGLLPTLAFAQASTTSATGEGQPTTSLGSAAKVYGPPAPAAPITQAVVHTKASPAVTDSHQSPPSQKRRRGGGYVGSDGGIAKAQ